jgi:hypothetical protein
MGCNESASYQRGRSSLRTALKFSVDNDHVAGSRRRPVSQSQSSIYYSGKEVLVEVAVEVRAPMTRSSDPTNSFRIVSLNWGR